MSILRRPSTRWRLGDLALALAAATALTALGATLVVRAAQPPPRTVAAVHTSFDVLAPTRTSDGALTSREYQGAADINLGGGSVAIKAHAGVSPDYGYDFVVLGNDDYVRLPGGDWRHLVAFGALDRQLSSLNDFLTPGDPNRIAGRLYAALVARGLPVQRLVDETIGDQPVEHYQVVTDQGGLPALLGAPGPQRFAWLIGQLAAAGQPNAMPATGLIGAATVTYDLWLGANDGFPYRYALRIDGGESGAFVVTADNAPLAQAAVIERPR